MLLYLELADLTSDLSIEEMTNEQRRQFDRAVAREVRNQNIMVNHGNIIATLINSLAPNDEVLKTKPLMTVTPTDTTTTLIAHPTMDTKIMEIVKRVKWIRYAYNEYARIIILMIPADRTMADFMRERPFPDETRILTHAMETNLIDVTMGTRSTTELTFSTAPPSRRNQTDSH